MWFASTSLLLFCRNASAGDFFCVGNVIFAPQICWIKDLSMQVASHRSETLSWSGSSELVQFICGSCVVLQRMHKSIKYTIHAAIHQKLQDETACVDSEATIIWSTTAIYRRLSRKACECTREMWNRPTALHRTKSSWWRKQLYYHGLSQSNAVATRLTPYTDKLATAIGVQVITYLQDVTGVLSVSVKIQL